MRFLTTAAVALLVAVQWPTTAKATMVWDADTLKLVSLSVCERASQTGVLMWVDSRDKGETRWFLWGRNLYSQRLIRNDGKLIASCAERSAE